MSLPIEDRLSNAMRSGSKADKALASYMGASLTELPFETAASIAVKVKVSEATVGRFCRSLGYESFRDLKEQLKGHIGDYPWLMSDRLSELRKNSADDETHFLRGLEMEIAGLVSIYEMSTGQSWRRVVKRLAHVERVHVAGFQTERGIAQYFAHQLQYVRDGVALLDLSSGNFAEALLSDRDSCLVIFEARHYSRQAKVLAEEARDAGIPVTLVTDLFCDWGAGVADEVLAVPTQVNQFWDSTAAMASLGNLLINGVFLELGPGVSERLNGIAKLFGRFTGHVGDPVAPIRK
ncbi:MurR/RpiR family transcriptional regulator [Sulfitobacter aestuarii]|uniref:MurR/RpiR family transcriptional regulator n=1 Tax=Sulfitobacter aestuarii TaxID=2161676 RepID=A0ABW5U5F9_9RHOB